MKNFFAVIDIGTSKIACGIFREKGKDQFELLGFGEEPFFEVKKGVLLNCESASQKIIVAMEKAQEMADEIVEEVYVNVLAGQTQDLLSTGIIAISGNNNDYDTTSVTSEDLTRALQMAESVSIPNDSRLLHTIPIEYVVDDNKVKDPVGVSGVRLEVRVCLITCTHFAIESLQKTLEKTDLAIKNITLDTLACAEATLSEEERKAGTLLIDIGHRTTSALLYYGDSIWAITTLPVGGAHLTQDLSYGLKTSMEQAEKIKRQHGIAMLKMAQSDKPIVFPLISYKKTAETTEKTLAKILEPRAREIFDLIKKNLGEKLDADLIGSGVVLTGGGSLCAGMLDLAEEVFEQPTRLGEPLYTKGVKKDLANPRYASLVGLAKIACLNKQQNTLIQLQKTQFNGIMHRLKGFLKNLVG